MCLINPTVEYVIPENGAIFDFGTFIDAAADYTLYNNEPRNTYTYGWKIVRIQGAVDISGDVVKTYY
jgi:hypothetical protein